MQPSENTFLSRHLEFTAAAACGLAGALAASFVSRRLAFPGGADIAFTVYIVLVLREMPGLTADYLRKRASAADLPVLLIFLLTAIVIAASVLSLFQIINSKGASHPVEFGLAMLAIPLGWFALQVMTAMHYARVYWMGDDEDGSGRKKPAGGLEFPGTDKPKGWDFLYFAVTIGMTFQTSDTEVTTSLMRGTVLAHAVVSFFFNTAIIAAAVNLAVSLGS